MTTYVLVHGAWGGAHTWRSVRPLLWAEGHHVFTPALTGVGERSHLTGPRVDLSLHVEDVVNLIRYEDLSDLVLVGFSYGGMVVTGALAHVAARVRELVYLDAFVPDDGCSIADLTGAADAEPVEPPLGVPWLIPPPVRTFDDPAEQEFAFPRRTPQPARTFTERVRLRQPLAAYPFGRTFIKATGDPRRAEAGVAGPDPFWDAADRVRDDPAWRYEELPSNHMVPQNQPRELAAILLSLA